MEGINLRPNMRLLSFAKGWIKRNLNGTLISWQGNSQENKIAITFDDGPHPRYSPIILDILRAEKVYATFFVNGNNVMKYPDIVRRMVDEGHEIGNHTYSHRRLKGLSLKEMEDEIGKTKEILKKICGKVNIIRPPWGSVSFLLLFYALRKREHLVLWTHDSCDSYSKLITPGFLVKRISQMPLCGGDIILFHEDNEHTALSLGEILVKISQKGFKFSRISDLIV